MMKSLKSIHIWVGTLGLAVFLFTGQYMHWRYHHLHGMTDGVRLLYRSAHIYLLWSCLLNVVLGCYMELLGGSARRIFQGIASVAIVVGPPLLCLSFFFESNSTSLARPAARLAIYLALAGVVLHGVTHRCKTIGGSIPKVYLH